MSYIEHKSEESVEDYLEAILMLSKTQPPVRSVDIARHLEFSKPSVSVAMKNLKQQELIIISDEGYISLTATGLEWAEKVYERHSILSEWLISIGVTPQTAIADACKIEHDLSSESFTSIKEFLKSHI